MTNVANAAVEKTNCCEKCGRQFILMYNRRTGEARQSWQGGCDTPVECFKRLMPPSDFTPEQEN